MTNKYSLYLSLNYTWVQVYKILITIRVNAFLLAKSIYSMRIGLQSILTHRSIKRKKEELAECQVLIALSIRTLPSWLLFHSNNRRGRGGR